MTLLLLHAITTGALTGLIWTVQIAIYPLFSKVAPAAFPNYHSHYTRRIGFVVAPLMFLEAATACLLLAHGERHAGFLLSLGALAYNWIATALVQVPLHRRLAAGFNPAAHEKLVRTNRWRTFAWSLRSACLLFAFY